MMWTGYGESMNISVFKPEREDALKMSSETEGSSGENSPVRNTQSSCSSEWLAKKSQKSVSSGSKSEEKINVRTHRDLVWGSVAVGESSAKFFTVVSEDSCRLSVYVQDTLHCYELMDVDGPVMGRNVLLHCIPRRGIHFVSASSPNM
jgi:hypothetical protein